MINFDTTINLGQIMTFVGFVVAGLIGIGTIREQVKGMREAQLRTDNRIGSMETELAKQTDILVNVARQDERINMLERVLFQPNTPAQQLIR